MPVPPTLMGQQVVWKPVVESGDTTGLGDGGVDEAVLASRQSLPAAGVSPGYLGREMPKEPFTASARSPVTRRSKRQLPVSAGFRLRRSPLRTQDL